MHRGYIYAKIPHLRSFYKYLYPEIFRCPAFLVFIAFTNMRSKAGDAEIDAEKVLKGIAGLFVHN